MDKFIVHFGVKVKNNEARLKINRENYAIIDNKNHDMSITKRRHYMMEDFLNNDNEKIRNIGKRYFENINKVFTDDSLEYFTDEFCKNHHYPFR